MKETKIIQPLNNMSCHYDKLKICPNTDYITGAIQYCVPPCYSCENYKI